MNESDPRSNVHYLGSSENKAGKIQHGCSIFCCSNPENFCLSQLIADSKFNLLMTNNFQRHQKRIKISLPCREMRIFVLHEASFIILSFRMLI